MEQSIDIKSIRSILDMTQAELGQEVGVDQSTVSNWENGQAPRGPALRLLHVLAKKAARVERKILESTGAERAA